MRNLIACTFIYLGICISFLGILDPNLVRGKLPDSQDKEAYVSARFLPIETNEDDKARQYTMSSWINNSKYVCMIKDGLGIGSFNKSEFFIPSVVKGAGVRTRMFKSYYMLIDEPGYYELTEDIINCTYEAAIFISAKNVVLDGKGHIVDGVNNLSSKYGIWVYWEADNVTIKNIIIQEWCWSGVFLDYGTENDIIYNCTIQNNNGSGIALGQSLYNIIYNCTIKGNYRGISLCGSCSKICSNTIQDNYYGIYIEDSNGSEIFFNNFINNTQHANNFTDNTWTTTNNITYTYNGSTYTNQLGNYWDTYTGTDTNGDGIGETPHEGDTKPLMQPIWNYKINDTDGDGLNDIQEETYGTDLTNNDTDNDGLNDGEEIYTCGTDPMDNDTDGDGMPDGWEVAYGFDPNNNSDANLDVDDDGLSNLQEFQLGTNPRNKDSDSDGWGDGEEVQAGTNPNDPNSYPTTKTTSPSLTSAFPMIMVVFPIIAIVVIIVLIRLRRVARIEKVKRLSRRPYRI